MVGEQTLAALAEKSHVLPVRMVMEEADALRTLILAKTARPSS